MNNKILISPSIIASDLSLFGKTVEDMDSTIVDLLHIDVMDGHFVPNLTFGPGYIKDLKNNTNIPLDVHLMIEKPENTIDEYLSLKPWCVTIHYESTRFPARLLQLIQQNGPIAGLALNPATPVEAVFDIIPYTKMVLIMSVDPGFYGQSFMETSLKRIKKIQDFLVKEHYTDVLIQVDGGITKDNISQVVNAGASVIVAGSSSFKGGNVNKNVAELKERAAKI